MLAPTPVSLAETEDGPADDLPAATVFVHMPTADIQKTIAYRSGPWQLTDTLQLGNKEEINGRISYVRLFVEKPLTDKLVVNKPVINKKISANMPTKTTTSPRRQF